MSVWSDHLDAIYASDVAVDAVLTSGKTGIGQSVRAIDKTAGVELFGPDGDVSVQTLKPAAVVRMSELADAGIARADLRGGAIVLGILTWTIQATRPKPSPEGEAAGELYLLLEGKL